MIVEQLYTNCLAEAAYYIESEGEVAIIDPLRDTDLYIQKAKERGATIKYVFETHFHADFVSGHVDLANITGATIVYGPNAKADFDFIEAHDNQVFEIGKIKIKVLHTPGHTPESSTYLLINEEGTNEAIFTGDTLFLGDVGRPDLAVKSELTEHDLAGMLYDSLRNKIMTLGDHITVYPAHGAGSACGKSMSKETVGTLGEQKKTNYALRSNMTKEEFIEEVLDGILPPPQYFPKNAVLNKSNIGSLSETLKSSIKLLDIEEFKHILSSTDALILDTRNEKEFIKGFIPGSVFIGISGNFATWVGTLIENLNQPLLIIADEGREEEIVTRLARVGYDHVQGFLKGGFKAWKGEVDAIESIDPSTFKKIMTDEQYDILDVRKPGEYDTAHLETARSLPLDYIHANHSQLNKDKKHLVHCAGGYRSVVYISIMKRKGYSGFVNIEQGFKGIETAGIPSIGAGCSMS